MSVVVLPTQVFCPILCEIHLNVITFLAIAIGNGFIKT